MLDTFAAGRDAQLGQHRTAMGRCAALIRAANTRSPISGAPPPSRSTATSITGDINSLAIIFDPPEELKGKINVLDSQGEVLALASLYLGIPQCTHRSRTAQGAERHAAGGQSHHWATFGSDTAKEVLVSGDAAAGMIYNGFSAKARDEGANVEYAYPKEGHVVWMDNVVLLKDAPNRDNALKFMNFLLEPENAAAVTNYAAYISGRQGCRSRSLMTRTGDQPGKQPARRMRPRPPSFRSAIRKPKSFMTRSGPI